MEWKLLRCVDLEHIWMLLDIYAENLILDLEISMSETLG